MRKPRQVQRKRTKGWRLPPNTVCVTRPGRWGNPYRDDQDPRATVARFREWLEELELNDPAAFEQYIDPLRGKNLACWCRIGRPCHRKVLLEYAAKPSSVLEAEPGETIYSFSEKLERWVATTRRAAVGRFNDRLLTARPGMTARDIRKPWDDAQRASYSDR